MLRYLTFALGVHAGAIALAFVHVTEREVYAPGSTTLQSRYDVDRSEIEVSERADASVDMPELVAETPPEVPPPRELILPAPEPAPDPPPPDEPTEWPEGDLPGRPSAAPARLEKTEVPPASAPVAPAEPAPETVESPAEEAKADRPPRADGVPGADQPPRLIAPDWPDEVRRNFAGRVLVAVVVSPAGQAVFVEIVEGTGNRHWDALLEDSFRRAPYTPGITNGMPVICSHRFRVTFRRR